MSTPTHVVTAGADLFADAVAAQAVDVTRVDWRPPMPGTEADLAAVVADPLRRDANERALAAMRASSRTRRTPYPSSRPAPASSSSPATTARPSARWPAS